MENLCVFVQTFFLFFSCAYVIVVQCQSAGTRQAEGREEDQGDLLVQ